MRISAIVVAAGSGTRFGRPKHELLLGGIPLWKHSVSVFESAGIAEIVVVGDVEGGIPGGRRRRDSVAAGLGAVDTSTDWVLVHDAARPLVTRALVARVTDEARKGSADGVVPALAVTDTLKEVSGEVVVGTVDRGTLAAVQTPQGFRREALAAAHALDPESDVTDDAGLIERLGGTVVTVPGETTNMKITYEGDLEIASLLYERLRNG
jgi:2-C-methyl-D-erythritol 4-phosphate cytidylyltransferase